MKQFPFSANLRFYPENITRNLELMCVLNMGEAVMIELARRGVGRHMKDVLVSRPEVIKYISAEEIEGIMDPEKYIGTAVEQVEAVVGRLRGEH